MTVEIRDGWVHGKLAGPDGRSYAVEHHLSPRTGNQPFLQVQQPVHLVLHTTEGDHLDSAIETLRSKFSPPQFAVGEHRIAQLRPVWAQGASVDTQNAHGMQVEIVGHSQVDEWLPAEPSLYPLAALTAFLHKRKLISTGLKRPTPKWPLHVDQLPAATDRYYRRKAGLWPHTEGVYGHIELPADEHWDPGGFDYPKFFELVGGLVGEFIGEESELALLTEDDQKALKAFLEELRSELGRKEDQSKPAAADAAGRRVARATKEIEGNLVKK
jgi:hypothetical protein